MYPRQIGICEAQRTVKPKATNVSITKPTTALTTLQTSLRPIHVLRKGTQERKQESRRVQIPVKEQEVRVLQHGPSEIVNWGVNSALFEVSGHVRRWTQAEKLNSYLFYAIHTAPTNNLILLNLCDRAPRFHLVLLPYSLPSIFAVLVCRGSLASFFYVALLSCSLSVVICCGPLPSLFYIVLVHR
jgi:hypothetical protein